MRKGYIMAQPVECVQAVIEKALNKEGVKLPVFNAFANTANGIFPGVGYAWINWRALDETSTHIAIEAQKASIVDAAYALFFDGAEQSEKVCMAEEPVIEAVEPEVINEEETKETEPEQDVLTIEVLGLKGKIAKAFSEGSGCETIADVAKLSLAELEAIPGVGAKTVEKIAEVMKGFGYKLK